jgi:hypothetical protein
MVKYLDRFGNPIVSGVFYRIDNEQESPYTPDSDFERGTMFLVTVGEDDRLILKHGGGGERVYLVSESAGSSHGEQIARTLIAMSPEHVNERMKAMRSRASWLEQNLNWSVQKAACNASSTGIPSS